MRAEDETIFALATGPGRGAIAVMRVSGRGALAALIALAGRAPPARRAALRSLRDPMSGDPIDDALVLWMPGPASFTGEDCVEFHLHGGSAIIAALTAALGGPLQCRLARPGEFTERAFRHGRLDLTQAEGIADLVEAETGAQLRQALRQARGELGAKYAAWRASLQGALALVEAAIDFPDEGLEHGLAARALGEARALAALLDDELAIAARGIRVRDGFLVAILGPPNAGKSSLLNRLVGADRAIVSARPGTTRDIVEVGLSLRGYFVRLADSAGLRETTDEIEEEGVRRAKDLAARADLRLFLAAPEQIEAISDFRPLMVEGDLVCLSQGDRLIGDEADALTQIYRHSAAGVSIFALSARDGVGLERLLDEIAEAAAEDAALGAAPALTRERHRQCVQRALEALTGAGEAAMRGPEVLAEHLRAANMALGELVGAVRVEDVLGAIFSQFCIGK